MFEYINSISHLLSFYTYIKKITTK